MTTQTEENELRYGHSPDPDDAYMFYGFAKGLAKIPGHRIRHVIEEIEALNRRAETAELEITAMSAHAYARLHDRYRIMSCGSSMGRGYGPIVAAKRPMKAKDLEGLRVATPGKQTTAALLAGIFLPPHEAEDVKFDETFAAVEDGRADAAVVIHEGQLTYRDLGFHLVCDLAAQWDKASNGLPLPLGLDTVRRDLPERLQSEICSALRKSILCAREAGQDAFDYAIQWGRGIADDVNRRFVGMYVNDDTLQLGADGEEALRLLYRLGREKGLLPDRDVPIDPVPWSGT